jgi:hypothetical protein
MHSGFSSVFSLRVQKNRQAAASLMGWHQGQKFAGIPLVRPGKAFCIAQMKRC